MQAKDSANCSVFFFAIVIFTAVDFTLVQVPQIILTSHGDRIIP